MTDKGWAAAAPWRQSRAPSAGRGSRRSCRAKLPSKVQTSCNSQPFLKLTHETFPPGLVAEQRGKNDSTSEKWEVTAEGFLTLPFSPFSSGPGSSQEARTRAITGRPAHASIQRRVTSSIFIFTVTVFLFPYKFEFSLVCRYCNEIINLSSLPQICTKEHYLSQVVDKF